jgi:thioredoxin-like negative regulator of GroEL
MILRIILNKQGDRFQIQKLKFVVCFLFCFGFILTNCSTPKTAKENGRSEADRQIKFFQDKIAKSKNHYPSYALLANAYLAKTRETGDPQYLAEARKNVQRSIAIQSNYQALKTMALISNYSHRFADAVDWAKKAGQASPEGLSLDSEVTAILVEAYLGLGQNDEAKSVLDELTEKKQDDFFIAASLGHFYKAENKIDEAVKAFTEAANFAGKENARELVVWANVSAAGCLLDSNRAAEAKPFLEKAKNINAQNKPLQIHQAEFLLADNRPQEALGIYEKLLKNNDDSEIHHQVFLIAQKLNDKTLAEKHFQLAIDGFRKVLASGEIYTLEPLAQIYCDAGENLAEAEQLARQNLEYKKDSSAKKTLRCVSEKLQG